MGNGIVMFRFNEVCIGAPMLKSRFLRFATE
jgi:hypothetical protein